MPSTAEIQAKPFKRGEKVRLVDDIPGVSTGSDGKVAVANGFTWKRYWVRFEDGRVIGHIDQRKLVRAKDYERFLRAREQEAQQAELAATEQAARPDAAEQATAATSATAGTAVNGVEIPAHLLARSAAARDRLGA